MLSLGRLSRIAGNGRALALAVAAMVALFGRNGESRAAAYPPDPVIPNAWGVQLKGGNANAETLDQIKSLGLKWVRRGFTWEAIEKQQGVYDFSAYDVFMDAAKARGLSVIGCLAFSNKLYGAHAKDEPGRTAYANYAAALARHYKAYDIVWEIWNEPNTMTFWGRHGKTGNSEQYAEEYLGLVQAAAPAIHAANPNAVILGGAVSGLWSASFRWMNFCFQKGMLKTGIDVWSVHPYTGACPEDYIPAYAKMREEMAAAGGPRDFPVINSERGYPIGRAEGYAGGNVALSHDYQAWHLVRQYLVDMMCGVKVTSWYEWSGKEGFSLYQPGQPTPAFTACKVLVDQLRGYRFDKRVDIGAPLDYVLRFTNDGGAVKLVAWTAPPPGVNKDTGGTPISGSPDKIVPHAAKIPVEADGALETCQIYGDKGTAQASGGAIELNLSGAPQYVSVRK